MNPPTPPAIETVELTQPHETVTGSPYLALDRVSLVVPAGQVVGILGKSGCGKTTLLRLLSGREDAHTGQVRISASRRVAAPSGPCCREIPLSIPG